MTRGGRRRGKKDDSFLGLGGGEMGLIGDTLKCGTAVFGIAQAGKAFKSYNEGKGQQQQQQGPPQGYYGGYPPQGQFQQGPYGTPPPQQQWSPPPQQQQQRGPPQQYYDNTGYLHQSWCNAQCGRQCNAAGNQDNKNIPTNGADNMSAPPAYDSSRKN